MPIHTDRELILAEIERLIQSNAYTHPEQDPSYGSNSIDQEGLAIHHILTHMKDFAIALPAAEEVDYWAVYIPGYDPSLFCIEGAARACAAGLSGKVHRVVIRRLEDKA